MGGVYSRCKPIIENKIGPYYVLQLRTKRITEPGIDIATLKSLALRKGHLAGVGDHFVV